MAEKNKQMITYDELCSEIFGSKESHPSTSEILESIFPTQSPKISGKESESVQSEVNGKTKNETLNSKIDSQDVKDYGGEAHNTKNSWTFEDQRIPPCHLSSSIYYGGQDDIYPFSQSTQNYAFNSYKSSGGANDSQTLATRDWWEGSYHY